MKCNNCIMWYADYRGDFPYCHADPDWPAPCEYDDEDYEDNSAYEFLDDY